MKLFSTIWFVGVATLVCFPLAALAQGKPAARTQQKVRTVTITGSDAMKYDVTTIAAHPGESLRIVLKNVGSMPRIAMAHNVVILRPNTDAAAFITAGVAARETEYIAPSAKAAVLAATALAGAGVLANAEMRPRPNV